jgi:hypothetical protein
MSVRSMYLGKVALAGEGPKSRTGDLILKLAPLARQCRRVARGSYSRKSLLRLIWN